VGNGAPSAARATSTRDRYHPRQGLLVLGEHVARDGECVLPALVVHGRWVLVAVIALLRRKTFASNALAAGVTVFELAKVMGTSVAMIERHYGTLIGGAHAGIAGRLDALEKQLEGAAENEAGRVVTRSQPRSVDRI
jgi:hypothetical protein